MSTFLPRPTALSTPLAWLGALAYTFQIYFDFSGYSDMAIGIGRMMGFQFPENFNSPYVARSITEFWQRWHITLGRWMRDYLYIPLGGNRVRPSRLYVNLWTVFILSGFWHGAAWTFIAWGAYHGLWLVLERLFLLRFYEKVGVFSILPTFAITVVGWVLFRAEALAGALAHIKRMAGVGTAVLAVNEKIQVRLGNDFWFTLGLAAFICFVAAWPKIERWESSTLARGHFTLGGAVGFTLTTVALLVLSVGYIVGSSFNPFIYFRF
jgi:alginate O-acetyltransferase complex protein AlgI